MRKLLVLLTMLLLVLGPLAPAFAQSPPPTGQNCSDDALREYLKARRAYLNVALAFAQAFEQDTITLEEAQFIHSLVALDISRLSGQECAGVLPFLTLQMLAAQQMNLVCIAEDNADCQAVYDQYWQLLSRQRDPILAALYVQAGINEDDLSRLWPASQLYQELLAYLQRKAETAPSVLPSFDSQESAL